MEKLFPTSTSGDGRLRRQYRNTSDEQGKGTTLRRVSCGTCGFPGADASKHDHSGGNLTGDGAWGTASGGDRSYITGGGCPLCGSKNFFHTDRRDEFMSAPFYSLSKIGS